MSCEVEEIDLGCSVCTRSCDHSNPGLKVRCLKGDYAVKVGGQHLRSLRRALATLTDRCSCGATWHNTTYVPGGETHSDHDNELSDTD